MLKSRVAAHVHSDCPSVLSLEDLALVEGFTDVFEVSLPGKVFLYHGLALLAVWIQFAPVVRFVVNLPVNRELDCGIKDKYVS